MSAYCLIGLGAIALIVLGSLMWFEWIIRHAPRHDEWKSSREGR